MERFAVRIAGLNISVASRFGGAREFMADYITDDETAEIHISATPEEIEQEKKLLGTKSSTLAERTCLHRALAEQLPVKNCLLCHGAAIEYGGRAYIFTAPSGTGKTTHISLWRESLGDSVHIINGDKPILWVSDEGVRVYSEPWSGKEQWQENTSAPLGAICLLRRGEENCIEKADAGEYIDEIFRQIYIPQETEALAMTLALTDKLLKSVPFYVLYCDISEQAVKVSFEGLTGRSFADNGRRANED